MVSLMNHINSDRDNPILAFAFSDEMQLTNYLAAKKLDMLLIAEELLEGLSSVVAQMNYMVLVKTRSPAGQAYPSLFKYSRVKDMVEAMLRRMNAYDTDLSSKLFCSYGVISPIGRCGKTNLATALCISDEVRGGLYIGLEEYSGYQDPENVISDMIYLAKERSPEFVAYIDSKVVSLEAYSVLGYLQSYRDALALELSDMLWIKEQFKNWGRFTTIAWDIGQAVLKDVTILESFDQIIVPVLEDEVSAMKLQAFDSLLEKEELIKVARRTKKVKVPNALPESAAMQGFIAKELM